MSTPAGNDGGTDVRMKKRSVGVCRRSAATSVKIGELTGIESAAEQDVQRRHRPAVEPSQRHRLQQPPGWLGRAARRLRADEAVRAAPKSGGAEGSDRLTSTAVHATIIR